MLLSYFKLSDMYMRIWGGGGIFVWTWVPCLSHMDLGYMYCFIHILCCK